MNPGQRAGIEIREFGEPDAAFLASVAQRLNPGATRSPRDPVALEHYFASLASSGLLAEPGAEAFVATIDGKPMGVVSVHPDIDYFTSHARAYVDILVVSQDAEGQGVGRALMAFVDTWARTHGCKEVVLDVFAGNQGALAFYERIGFAPDHLRLAKPLD